MSQADINLETTYPLTIEFREGFYGDTVIVIADGAEVYRQTNITTRTMIGLADSTNLQLSSGQHNLRIMLMEKEASVNIQVEIRKPLYLGMDYDTERGLEYKFQGEPFKYM